MRNENISRLSLIAHPSEHCEVPLCKRKIKRRLSNKGHNSRRPPDGAATFNSQCDCFTSLNVSTSVDISTQGFRVQDPKCCKDTPSSPTPRPSTQYSLKGEPVTEAKSLVFIMFPCIEAWMLKSSPNRYVLYTPVPPTDTRGAFISLSHSA